MKFVSPIATHGYDPSICTPKSTKWRQKLVSTFVVNLPPAATRVRLFSTQAIRTLRSFYMFSTVCQISNPLTSPHSFFFRSLVTPPPTTHRRLPSLPPPHATLMLPCCDVLWSCSLLLLCSGSTPSQILIRHRRLHIEGTLASPLARSDHHGSHGGHQLHHGTTRHRGLAPLGRAPRPTPHGKSIASWR
jgi:hypothetical protein